MKVSLVSRIVSLIGASLMVVLVLQATGLLDVINSQTKGSGKPQDGQPRPIKPTQPHLC